MEVHAHTHTARKKWTHYFWEFIMLFLAVFCGLERRRLGTFEDDRSCRWHSFHVSVLCTGLKSGVIKYNRAYGPATKMK